MANRGAITGEFERSICAIKMIPDKKTIASYELALESAVIKFFLERDWEDLVLILKDAKEHRKWPKNFRSLYCDEFQIGAETVWNAVFNLRKMQVSFCVRYCHIKITPENVIMDYKFNAGKKFMKVLRTYQEGLQEIKKIAKL